MAIFMVLGASLATIVLLFLIVYCFIKLNQKRVVDGPGMINGRELMQLKYYHGGSSLGDMFLLTIKDEKLNYLKCEGQGAPKIEKERIVDEKTREKVLSLLEEGGVRKWKNLPKTEYDALDEASTNFHVIFADGVEVRVENDDMPPEEGWQKVREIVQILELLAEQN